MSEYVLQGGDRQGDLVVGADAGDPIDNSDIVLHPTWDGWAAGCVRSARARLPEAQELTVSGVLAAALAISESFQHVRGSVTAGHRDIGLSLWDLRADWRKRHDATGR
jgi:hypothetical protein